MSVSFSRIWAVVVFLSVMLFGSPVFSGINLPQKIMVLGQEVSLQEKKGDMKQGFIAEYIPPGKTWDDWEILFAVRFHAGAQLDPKSAAHEIANAVLAQKRNGNPVANAAVFQTDSGWMAVDFLTSEEEMSVVEHNIWFFVKTAQGLISYQLARRVYSTVHSPDDMKIFVADVDKMRQQIFDELTAQANQLSPQFQ